MNNEDIIKLLETRSIKPTALRILILKEMLACHGAFSLSDLENLLPTVERSTIFRTITLFHSKHLIHSIDDGSGSIKYSVCSSKCNCEVEDLHVHFCCISCNKVFCMEDIPVPALKLKQGFILKNANFVLKGYCDKCSPKHCN